MTIFFNILDIACYNSLVIYCDKFPEHKHELGNKSRRPFIKLLVDEIKDKYRTVEQAPVIPNGKISKYVQTGK